MIGAPRMREDLLGEGKTASLNRSIARRWLQSEFKDGHVGRNAALAESSLVALLA